MKSRDIIIPLDTPKKFEDSILDIINSASQSDKIFCNYFVVRFDQQGRKLLQALASAALRGAEVHLLIDSYGSLHKGDNGTEYSSAPLSLKILNSIEAFGVNTHIYRHIYNTKFFHPYNMYHWTNYSRRNHNKNFIFNIKSLNKKGLIIGDSQWANEHFSNTFRGNNVYIESEQIYKKSLDYTVNLLHSQEISSPKDHSHKSYNLPFKKSNYSNYTSKDWYSNENHIYPKSIKYVFNEINFRYANQRKTIQDHEVSLMEQAQSDIWYSTPYFCPDKILQESFILNKKNKKNIHILIAKFRNDPYIPYGTKLACLKLLRHRISIHEYEGNGNIHYKDLITDNISFIKTANGEGRSRFFNLESGVIIDSKEYALLNKENIKSDIRKSQKLNLKTQFIKEPLSFKRMAKEFLCPLYYHHL